MSTIQTYEDYWQFTAALTDYNGSDFIDTLKICVDFVDEYCEEPYSEAKYERLQEKIIAVSGINAISVRKRINQLVKMGFIDSFLISYNPDAKSYLIANTNRKRRSILSKVIYSSSSFTRSVKNKSDLHHLNFLINTLIEVSKLSKADIIALMLVDISTNTNGFVNRSELDSYVESAKSINFIDRKYNQISHLINLLSKLDEIVFVDNKLYFTEDAIQIFGEKLEIETRKRNPYLHLLYKNQLKEESASVFNIEKCMVEKRAFPTLIASHIKPFIVSSETEAYDPNNGILLSQNLDGLFDKGAISFNDDGSIIISQRLDDDLKVYLQSYALDNSFIRSERLNYLDYHRNNVFRS